MRTPYGQWAMVVNGVSVGAGTSVGITEITGLEETPDLRTSDSPNPAADGDTMGTDYQSSRIIQVTCDALMTDASMLTALRGALVVGRDTSLTVSGVPGLPDLLFRGRLRKARVPMDRNYTIGHIQPEFQFYCPDPLRYAATESVLTLDLREQITGHSVYATPRPYASPIRYDGVTGAPTVYLTPPVTPPVTPGGRPGMVATLTALNAGLYPTAPIIRVFGPSPAFSLLQGTTNRRWSYTQPVDASDFLEIDMRARTVLLNGTASRRQFKRGAWWDLPPGSSSVAFLPNEPAVGAQVEVRFRSAY